MRIIKNITVNAPVEKVWDILGPNYVDAGNWASAVFVSREQNGTKKVADAPVAGRICQTSLGPFTESIEDYNLAAYRIAYSASGAKMPGFVKSLVNAWHLESVGTNQTRVEMDLNADIAFPFSFLMGWMMKMQFNKALSETIEDLKYYAETGKPHPRKIAADNSKKAFSARQAAV